MIKEVIERREIRMRWFILGSGIALLLLAYKTGETIEAVIAFCVGALLGFLIDYIGMGKLNLWSYPRQPFLSKKFFFIVIPAWGVFGMTINLLWIWFGHITVSWIVLFILITVGLLIFYEFSNLNSKSWEYRASSRLVISGWFPMVLFFRFAFLMLPVADINDIVRSVLF